MIEFLKSGIVGFALFYVSWMFTVFCKMSDDEYKVLHDSKRKELKLLVYRCIKK